MTSASIDRHDIDAATRGVAEVLGEHVVVVDWSGIPSDELLAVPDDRDRLRRTSLAGEDDLVLRLRVGIDHDRDAVVVEVEHTWRPERAVPRAHAGVAVDLDLQRHGS